MKALVLFPGKSNQFPKMRYKKYNFIQIIPLQCSAFGQVSDRNKLPHLCVCGRAARLSCSFGAAVQTVDVLSHRLAVGCYMTTLYTGVTPSGVFPEDTSAAGHTWKRNRLLSDTDTNVLMVSKENCFMPVKLTS